MKISDSSIVNIRKELMRRQKLYRESARNHDDPEVVGFLRGKAAAMDDMIYLLERSVSDG